MGGGSVGWLFLIFWSDDSGLWTKSPRFHCARSHCPKYVDHKFIFKKANLGGNFSCGAAEHPCFVMEEHSGKPMIVVGSYGSTLPVVPGLDGPPIQQLCIVWLYSAKRGGEKGGDLASALTRARSPK